MLQHRRERRNEASLRRRCLSETVPAAAAAAVVAAAAAAAVAVAVAAAGAVERLRSRPHRMRRTHS